MRASLLSGSVSIALCVLGLPALARAQDLPIVSVLGLSTEEADDAETAENLTSVLRRAVEETRTVRASGREATLAQMSLAFGCEDPPDTTCLQQIGQELQSKLLVYGQIARTRRGADYAYGVTVRIFDVEAGRELRSNQVQLPRTAHDFEDLRDPARRMMAALLAGDAGSLEITSEAEGGVVRVDGDVAGEIGDGSLRIASLTPGEHRIEIEAEGFEPYETTAVVHPGETATVRARLVATRETLPPGEQTHHGHGVRPLQWVGAGALVVGAILSALAIAWAADVQSTNDSAAWTEARYRFRSFDPGADSVCDANLSGADASGNAARFDGIFQEGELGTDGDGHALEPNAGVYSGDSGDVLDSDAVSSTCTHRWGQWVLGGLGIASAVVGTYLVFGAAGSHRDEADTASGARLVPLLDRQAGLGLHLDW
jgi:PEGA domain-containing protein